MWELPGGGLKSQETGAAAAVREVEEETGIKLEPEELNKLAELTGDNGETEIIYLVELKNELPVKLRPLELTRYSWLDLEQISASSLNDVADQAIELLDRL
jgi:8-oxo-dGTP pyrophosphatase MutT (NUDIX family)